MLNRYAYARNNPIRYVDPDGHTGGEGVLVFVRSSFPIFDEDSSHEAPFVVKLTKKPLMRHIFLAALFHQYTLFPAILVEILLPEKQKRAETTHSLALCRPNDGSVRGLQVFWKTCDAICRQIRKLLGVYVRIIHPVEIIEVQLELRAVASCLFGITFRWGTRRSRFGRIGGQSKV